MHDWMTHAGRIFAQAGWVAWPLAVLSVVSVGLCLERWLALRGMRRQTSAPRLAPVAAALAAGDLAGARRAAPGPLVAGYLGLLGSQRPGVDEWEAHAAGDLARERLERFLPFLSTVITAAPMLGILGTVTGIIQSFGLLGDAETVRDTTAMAAGISEALYTTAFGLTLALVLILPYNAFRVAASRCAAALETLGLAALAGSGAADPAQSDSASTSRS